MPRKARKNEISKYHHIMSQGINKEFIFKNEKHIEKYQKLMKEKKKDLEISILSYCIMSNHVHILVYSEDFNNISKYMQRLNTAYSIYYNKATKRVGYVFRDRFLSQEILDQRQLMSCVKYIHYNPIKAGVVKKAYEYKYSSFNEFFEKKYITDENAAKLIFGDENGVRKNMLELHSVEFDEYQFIDIKEKDIFDFMKDFKSKYHLSMLIKDKKLLEDTIKKARRETDVSIRDLAELLDVSKSTISRYENI